MQCGHTQGQRLKSSCKPILCVCVCEPRCAVHSGRKQQGNTGSDRSPIKSMQVYVRVYECVGEPHHQINPQGREVEWNNDPSSVFISPSLSLCSHIPYFLLFPPLFLITAVCIQPSPMNLPLSSCHIASSNGRKKKLYPHTSKLCLLGTIFSPRLLLFLNISQKRRRSQLFKSERTHGDGCHSAGRRLLSSTTGFHE